MPDHQLPAERQALLDYIAVLLKNPQLDDERVLNALSSAMQGLLGKPQHVMAATEHMAAPTRKPRLRNSPSDDLYVKGLIPALKNFLDKAEADMDIGLSVEEIRLGLFNRGDIPHSVTKDHIQRVLTANQRHWQKLPNGNWRPKPNMNKISGSSDRRLLESKKRSKSDHEQHSQS